MKIRKYIIAISAVAVLFGAQSCFQDMDDSPSFNYPEDGALPQGEQGEEFYMSFEDTYTDLVREKNAGKEGEPTFAEGKIGKAYAGATDSYLTFGTGRLILEKEFSASFWYKLNPLPNRAGIIVLSPLSPNGASSNLMTSGFRLFRETAGADNRIKLNVGSGEANHWFDGGAKATVPDGVWTHVAFTISETECTVYINGNVASTSTFPGISWNGTAAISIGSGAPRFVEWNHHSDLSSIDELRFFRKALTQAEVQALMNLQ